MGFFDSLFDGMKKGYDVTHKESDQYYVKCPKCGQEIRVWGAYGEVKCSKCDIVIKYD